MTFVAGVSPWDHGDSFYARNQQLRGSDREDSISPVLSFTYREVRQHVIDTFGEMVAYGLEGICLLYNRRHPIVEYEPPLIEGFREQHGADPRELPTDDPTWLRYRAGVLTGFTRELHDTLGVGGSHRSQPQRKWLP